MNALWQGCYPVLQSHLYESASTALGRLTLMA